MGKNASGLFVQVTEVLKVSQGAALALAMFFQAVRNQDSCQELVMPRPAVSGTDKPPALLCHHLHHQ